MAGKLTGQTLTDLSNLTAEYLCFLKNKCNVDFLQDSSNAISTVMSKCIVSVLENLVSRHKDFKAALDNFSNDVSFSGYTKDNYGKLYKYCMKVANLDVYKSDIDISLIMCAVITSFSNENDIEKTKAYFLNKFENYGIPYDKHSQLLFNVCLWNYNYENYRNVLNNSYKAKNVNIKSVDNNRKTSDQVSNDDTLCFKLEDLPFSQISSSGDSDSIKTLIKKYFLVIIKLNFFKNQILFAPVVSCVFFLISAFGSKNYFLLAAPLCLLNFLLSEHGDINSSKAPVPNTVLTVLALLSALINIGSTGSIIMFVVTAVLALLSVLQWIAVKKDDCKQIVKSLILYAFPALMVFSVVIIFLGLGLFGDGIGLIPYGLGMLYFQLVQCCYYCTLMPVDNSKINIPIIFFRNFLVRRQEKIKALKAESDQINDRINKAQSKASVFDSALNANSGIKDSYQDSGYGAFANNVNNQNTGNQGYATLNKNDARNNVNKVQPQVKPSNMPQYETDSASSGQKTDDDARRSAAAKQKAEDDARRAAAAKQKAEDDARRTAMIAKQKAEDDANRNRRISDLEEELKITEEKECREFETLYLDGKSYASLTDEERMKIFMANCIKLYEEKIKGTWSNCGGAIMSDTHALNYVDSFTYSSNGMSSKAGSGTITTYLTADETGKCYLLIKYIDSTGYLKKSSMGEIAFSSDNNFFTMNCTDGSVFVFKRA